MSDSEIHSNAIRDRCRAEFLPKAHTLENIVRNVQKDIFEMIYLNENAKI